MVKYPKYDIQIHINTVCRRTNILTWEMLKELPFFSTLHDWGTNGLDIASRESGVLKMGILMAKLTIKGEMDPRFEREFFPHPDTVKTGVGQIVLLSYETESSSPVVEASSSFDFSHAPGGRVKVTAKTFAGKGTVNPETTFEHLTSTEGFAKLHQDLTLFIVVDNSYPQLMFNNTELVSEPMRGRAFSIRAGKCGTVDDVECAVIDVSERLGEDEVIQLALFVSHPDREVVDSHWFDLDNEEDRPVIASALLRTLRYYLDNVQVKRPTLN